MSTPLVSIIIPTYNSRTTLAWTLRSVLRQECADFEVWVVGDGSTDGSEEVVASFGDERFNWVNLEKNSGNQSIPNNTGIKKSTGKFIAHLGHDDLWLPGHLSGLLELIESTGADFVHAQVAQYAPGGLVGILGAPSKGRTYATSRLVPSTWLYRREVFDVCGEWEQPEGLQQAIDVDYVRRVNAAGKRIVAADRVTVLKYPSHYWNAYQRTEGWPQEEPCRLIETDPVELERRLSVEMSALLASQWRPLLSAAEIRREVYERLRDNLLAPRPGGLAWVRRRVFQYLRMRSRKARGLS